MVISGDASGTATQRRWPGSTRSTPRSPRSCSRAATSRGSPRRSPACSGAGVLVTSTDGRERAAHLDDAARATLAEADLRRPDRPGPGRADRPRRCTGRRRARCGRCASPRAAPTWPGWCVSGGTAGSAEDDVHALERAATVAALLITREDSITAVENKYQGDFLRELFAHRTRDAAYVEEHAVAFGWDLDRPVVVVVAAARPVRTRTAVEPRAPAVPGAVLRGLAAGDADDRARGSRASTSPRRWSRCCRCPRTTADDQGRPR